MKPIIAVLLASALATGAAFAAPGDDPLPTSKRGAVAAWTEDGLQKVTLKGLDAAYVRPGSDVASYTGVRLAPIRVSFRRDWERSVAGRAGRVRPEDAQRIRDKVAALVREEFATQLAAGGYAVTEAAGDDVLELDIAITDLYLVAPDLPTAGRIEVFAVSAGEMTLVAELRDSVSGETAMRLYDHGRARESARPERIVHFDNEIEARRVAAGWAKALREALDAARAAKP
jgi:hypothetical protein